MAFEFDLAVHKGQDDLISMGMLVEGGVRGLATKIPLGMISESLWNNLAKALVQVRNDDRAAEILLFPTYTQKGRWESINHGWQIVPSICTSLLNVLFAREEGSKFISNVINHLPKAVCLLDSSINQRPIRPTAWLGLHCPVPYLS